MPSARIRRQLCASARVILVFGPLTLALASPSPARADSGTATIAPTEARHPFPGRESSGRSRSARPESAGGWWLGTAGIALALALCGGISVASKRYLPQRGGAGLLRVIARASLSPKQAVYLVEVGERVLIVGAGAQGPPSLLGELTDPAERARFGVSNPSTVRPPVAASSRSAPASTGRFDQRLGDDE